MNRPLLETLVRCSAELQRAHQVARDAGREDIAQLLRKASWQIAAAITECVPDSSEAVRS
jgi:hypothetical protein